MATTNTSRCLFKTETALYRVLSTASRRQMHQHTRSLASNTSSSVLSSRLSAPAPPFGASSARQLHSQGHLQRDHRRLRDGPVGEDEDAKNQRGFSPLFTTAEDIKASGRDRMPRDFEIKDPRIMVLENETIAGPLPTKYVMTRLDPDKESLRMVRPYIPVGSKVSAREARDLQTREVPAEDYEKKPSRGRTSKSREEGGQGEKEEGAAAGDGPKKMVYVTTQEAFAQCEIVNKMEARQAEMALKKQRKATPKMKNKEVTVTWSTAEHDLEHKLRSLRDFLSSGMKVVVTVTPKKRAKLPAKEVMEELKSTILKTAEECGARVERPFSGELGTSMNVSLEGKVKKKVAGGES